MYIRTLYKHAVARSVFVVVQYYVDTRGCARIYIYKQIAGNIQRELGALLGPVPGMGKYVLVGNECERVEWSLWCGVVHLMVHIWRFIWFCFTSTMSDLH